MPRNSVAYDEDFFAWTQEQARLLREGDLTDVDAENLAEEIESAGKSDRREIRNRLTVLLAHLLKWQFQPRRKGTGWSGTIFEQRLQINSIIEDSPSLQPFFYRGFGRVVSACSRRRGARNKDATRRFPGRMPLHAGTNPQRGLSAGVRS